MAITVCFTGHRPQSFSFGFDETHPDCQKIKKLIENAIDWIISENEYVHFITGMALGVDMWAADVVLARKRRNNRITLEAAIPCATQTSSWSYSSVMRYESIKSRCDKVTCLNDKYLPGCMMQRNKYMVDKSDIVVSVWNGKDSGTGKTVNYALDKGKTVYNIDPVTFDVRIIQK